MTIHHDKLAYGKLNYQREDMTDEQISLLLTDLTDDDEPTAECTAYVYIVQCADQTYYTGWTNDLAKRIESHNSGNGAKYTRGRTPVELVYAKACNDKSEALREEYRIKNLPRQKKQALIDAYQQNEEKLL